MKAVVKDSPAERVGIKPGDLVVRIDDLVVRNGFDFHLGLVERKAGEKPRIQLKRGDESLTVQPELAVMELAEPVKEEGMVAGLRFEAFTGEWERLPDFDALQAVIARNFVFQAGLLGGSGVGVGGGAILHPLPVQVGKKVSKGSNLLRREIEVELVLEFSEHVEQFTGRNFQVVMESRLRGEPLRRDPQKPGNCDA